MRSTACAVLILVAGCNHQKTTTQSANALHTPASQVATSPHVRDVTKDRKMSHTLAMSSDLIQLCGIKPTGSAGAPKFGFDKDELTDDDHNVLQQLATCMRTGPLRGKNVELIGRADPRGTEEYNLALGSRRARSVNQYLQWLGVDQGHLSQTTRGALDATGIDEAGWANDRRVDIMLERT